jgi:hypothetical protein
MTERTPHNDELQAAVEGIVDAFALPPTEERTQAILAAYLEHDRARANALMGTINHLAVVFDQAQRKLHHEIRQMSELLTSSLEPLIDRLHTISNQQMAHLEMLYQQADYASTLDVRLTAIEERQQSQDDQQQRILKEMAEIRQQLAQHRTES